MMGCCESGKLASFRVGFTGALQADGVWGGGVRTDKTA